MATETKVKEPKMRHTNSTNEILVTELEEADTSPVSIPNIRELAGLDDEEVQGDIEGENGYTTTNLTRSAFRLNQHPSIVCGRCELCGSTEYVKNGKKDYEGAGIWEVINKKTNEVTYKARGGKKIELDAAHCKHYGQVTISCGYCAQSFSGAKNPVTGQFTEVLGSRNVYVFSDKRDPKNLIMVCSDFNCKHSFNQQYLINQTAS